MEPEPVPSLGGVRLPHVDSGEECLVTHFDTKTGELLPPCRRCARCGEMIRPECFDLPECAG